MRALREKIQALSEINNKFDLCNIKKYIKRLKGEYRKKIALAKKDANSKYANSQKNKNRAMWNILKIETARSNNSPVTNSIDSAEFNTFFAEIANTLYSNLGTNNFNPTLHINIEDTMFLLPTDVFEVSSAIKSLSNSKVTDVYGISSTLLKSVATVIAPHLTNLFNSCFETGIFPDKLKLTKIIPIFKKGDPLNLTNYRPIAIVPTFSKVFEILLKNRLLLFFSKNKIFNSAQFGFRPKLSTIKAATELIGFITQSLEMGHIAHATFCDLSKAFDCVPHDLLLDKLSKYGVRGKVNELFSSYLSNRHQFVVHNGQKSELIKSNYGVGQGSILGPLLFIIFINDLPHHLNKKVVLYADDTTILNARNSLVSLNQDASESFKKAEEWFTANKLTLNSDKTMELIFSLNRNIAGKQINKSEPVKFLGLVLDGRLDWADHVEYLSVALRRATYAILKLRNSVSGQMLRMFYFASVHSRIAYGILLWGSCSHMDRIFKIQKRVLRIMNGVSNRTSCRSLFVGNRIMTVYSLFVYTCLMYAKENGEKFVTAERCHDYNTRNKLDFRLPKIRLNKSMNGVYLAAKFYNHLPAALKDIGVIPFKKKIKAILIENCLYGTDEFYNIDFF